MDPDDDVALRAALEHAGASDASFLGSGGEARVYALDADRVLRITHAGADLELISKAIDFVRDLRRPAAMALPEVLDIWEHDDRVVTIEQRLRGRSLLDALADVEPGTQRHHLIESHLEASAAIPHLFAGATEAFGEFLVRDPVTGASLHEFLGRRAAWSLAQAGGDFPAVEVARLTSSLPDLTDPNDASLVHLDAFAGNMMCDGQQVTALFDFGGAVVFGAAWMNAVSTAVYLSVPTITPTATTADVEVARSWLRAHDLDSLEAPLRRWLAAYWAFAVDDETLHRWCRSVFT